MAAPNLKPQFTLQDIESEMQRRTAAHQAEIAASRAPAGELTATVASGLNLMADGDSWFDYLPSKYPLPESDVIWQLKNKVGSPRPTCLNFAVAGDATTQSLGCQQQQRMIEAIQTPANGTFDAILYSGGGDDLAGDQFCIWLDEAASVGDDPNRALNSTRFGELLGLIRSSYENLVQFRDEYPADKPIFIHGYDYPAKLGVPVTVGPCTMGPWLSPSLKFRGWTSQVAQTQVAKLAIEQFNTMLVTFVQAQKNVIYVETPGTLAGPDDWDNELHPTPDGFNKIAQKFASALRTVFPGRI